ncbi:unnamed protein product [Penicillium pancosmium]
MDSSAHFTLSVLPPEILEEIMTYLDLATLKALRLSSRALYKDSTGFRFKHFIRIQSIELRQSSLESLQDLLAHPALGPAVKELEIVATIYDQTPQMDIVKAWEKKQKTRDQPTADPAIQSTGTGFRRHISDPSREDFLQAEADLAWLRTQQLLQDEFSYDDAVKQLAFCLSLIRKLRRIELDATIIQGPISIVTTDTGKTNWYPVWMRASRTYCITMEAITQSNIELKTLIVYQRTSRCSKGIECLSLSISNKVTTGATDRPPRTPIACHAVAWYGKRPANAAYISSLGGITSGGNENFDGLARLLNLTSNLKTLDIHMYNTKQEKFVDSHFIFEAVSRETLLPHLRKCSFGGIITTEDSLIQFLSKHSNIAILALNQIQLPSEESWKPVFAHLEQSMPGLEHLHLSTLRGGDRQSINLHPLWDDHPEELEVNRRSSIHYVHTKAFKEDDISKGLKFRQMPFAPFQGAPEAAQWIRSVKAHYGAPWESNTEYISSDLGGRL